MFTDIHFGESGDSDHHNQLCLEFIEWFIGQAKRAGCDTIVFLGDWHHNQIRIGSSTLNYSVKGLELLNNSGLPVVMLIGNHDIKFKESRSVHSLPFASMFPNITMINETTVIGDMAFVPWVTEPADLQAAKVDSVKYVFGHFEFPGFYMNEAYIMPEKSGAIKAEDFPNPLRIFSGHYHKRQMQIIKKTEVIYIGNPFPHDFSDAGDRERGMAVFDADLNQLSFIDWPSLPTFDRVPLSTLLENPEKFGERSTIRVIPDITLTSDEMDEIRSALSEGQGIRNIFFEPAAVENEYVEVSLEGEDGKAPSVDEMVIAFLTAQDWTTIGSNPQRMIDAYLSAEI